MFNRLTSALRSFVAPQRCLACNVPVNSSFCAECAASLGPPLHGEFEGAPLISAGVYKGALASGIRRFKYEPRPELANGLAGLLVAPAERMSLPRETLWVPVPLHYARLVERGFNQSSLLARSLSQSTRTRFEPRALIRARETSQQAQLGRSERAENMRDAFCLRAPIAAEIVLIDDVLTTGATLRACIFALREKGVKVRAVFTLARTHPL